MNIERASTYLCYLDISTTYNLESIAFEPGVAERGRTKYKLQSFVAVWLGKPGGGGHAYSYDL